MQAAISWTRCAAREESVRRQHGNIMTAYEGKAVAKTRLVVQLRFHLRGMFARSQQVRTSAALAEQKANERIVFLHPFIDPWCNPCAEAMPISSCSFRFRRMTSVVYVRIAFLCFSLCPFCFCNNSNPAHSNMCNGRRASGTRSSHEGTSTTHEWQASGGRAAFERRASGLREAIDRQVSSARAALERHVRWTSHAQERHVSGT